MAEAKKNQFNQTHNDVSDLGKALSHPARVMILEILAQENQCVGDLVERIPLAQSTISQHIKELKKHGLILAESRGQQSFYCINHPRYQQLQLAMAQFFNKKSV
ncbi:metalloregulator ArsR/SmtB family transcription factor [Vibrio sp. S4M6]|uniref:ArsR/SmtB family transcription factor n=1 Tax=Vibrio sinus TaxID=2946865 RepID=UPI00202A9DA4|nr:metalloregulator ArsR/SmtB family transcription factor [Vibrio sinus]MCL9782708.1 metalloregulator ArsR/SmtB family transcription factor [Vibrio sinus]